MFSISLQKLLYAQPTWTYFLLLIISRFFRWEIIAHLSVFLKLCSTEHQTLIEACPNPLLSGCEHPFQSWTPKTLGDVMMQKNVLGSMKIYYFHLYNPILITGIFFCTSSRYCQQKTLGPKAVWQNEKNSCLSCREGGPLSSVLSSGNEGGQRCRDRVGPPGTL